MMMEEAAVRSRLPVRRRGGLSIARDSKVHSTIRCCPESCWRILSNHLALFEGSSAVQIVDGVRQASGLKFMFRLERGQAHDIGYRERAGLR